MADKEALQVYLPEIVGKGYRDFWHFKGRYRVVKGSRASKKSKTTALWFIYNMMKYKNANLLVVRKVYRTLKDSCFAELSWAVHRLAVSHLWQMKRSPMEMVFMPTGQKIFFRGLDNPLKIASISAEAGKLCWVWIEEAFEIQDEQDFLILDESIRGQVFFPLFKQITLTLNPWNERHWIKKRFFDKGDQPDVLAMTTNYMMNEFLDAADIQLFQDMAKQNPRRYQVAGLGEWGVTEGLIYENWSEAVFNDLEMAEREGARSAFGLDFGYTNDPTALFCGLVDIKKKEIYVFDELYERGLTNAKIYEKISAMGYGKELIRADSSEPKSITELKELGLLRVRAARKGKDSVNNGIQFIQGFSIKIHPRCKNFLQEISTYAWETNFSGQFKNVPADKNNHLLDAMRYAMEPFLSGSVFSFD